MITCKGLSATFTSRWTIHSMVSFMLLTGINCYSMYGSHWDDLDHDIEQISKQRKQERKAREQAQITIKQTYQSPAGSCSSVIQSMTFGNNENEERSDRKRRSDDIICQTNCGGTATTSTNGTTVQAKRHHGSNSVNHGQITMGIAASFLVSIKNAPMRPLHELGEVLTAQDQKKLEDAGINRKVSPAVWHCILQALEQQCVRHIPLDLTLTLEESSMTRVINGFCIKAFTQRTSKRNETETKAVNQRINSFNTSSVSMSLFFKIYDAWRDSRILGFWDDNDMVTCMDSAKPIDIIYGLLIKKASTTPTNTTVVTSKS